MRVAVCLCVGLLAGCASTYHAPPDTQSKATAMSDAEAQRHLARLLQPSEKAGGFCVYSEGAYAWKEANVAMEGERLSFQAPVITKVDTQIQTGIDSRNQTISVEQKKTGHFSLRKFTVDLTLVDNIRLMDADNGVAECGRQLGRGKVVTMRTGSLVLEINVVDDDAQELVASLIHFAPNAKLLTGHGL
jgi:hypothetical protein